MWQEEARIWFLPLISNGLHQAIINEIINSTIDFNINNTRKTKVALEGVDAINNSCGFSEAPLFSLLL